MTSRIGPSSGPRAFGRVAGFSLLELILVMLVLAVAAALAAPSLSRFARGRQSSDAAAHLLAVIQFAQDRAAAGGDPVRLYVDTNSGTYYLAARRDGVYSRLGEEFGRTFNMPDTVTLDWDAAEETRHRGYLQFDPDGGHDTAVLKVIARDGDVFLIGCDTAAEPYRIELPNGQGAAR